VLTVYARKVFHRFGYDVTVWSDAQMTLKIRHYQWHHSLKPTYRNAYIMINCARYNIIWLK